MTALRRVLTLVLAALLSLPAAVSTRAADLREGPFPLTDVAGTPYARPVDLLWRLQIVSGTSTTQFTPSVPVTRAQMATFLIRALGRSDLATARVGQSRFDDVATGYWGKGFVNAAAEMGLIQGSQNRFRPEDLVTFAEAVTMMVRAAGYEPMVTGSWPEAHLTKAQELGLLAGLQVGPLDPVSRGDLSIMLAALVFKVTNATTARTLNQSVFQLADRIELAPAAAALPPGRVRITARVVDPYGQELPVVPAVREESGKLALEQGYLQIPAGVDSVTLRAYHGNLSVSRTYQVARSALKLSAAHPVVRPGAQVALRAEVAGPEGPMSVQPEWAVTAGNATVDAGGTVTIAEGAQGTVTVQARAGETAATLQLRVSDRLAVSPEDIVLPPEGSATFTARVPGGQPGDSLTAVTWQARVGQIGADGRYVAPAQSASDTVTAVAGTVSGQAQVRVASSLELEPALARVALGQTQSFTALASVEGRRSNIRPDAWTVEGGIGSVDSEGRFTASGSGQGSVVARFGSLSARVPVNVPALAARLELAVSPVQLRANGKSTATVTARLVDDQGAAITRDGVAVAFAVTDSGLASLPTALAETRGGIAEVQLVAGTRSGTTTVQALAVGTGLPVAKQPVSLTAPTPARLKVSAFPMVLGDGQAGQVTLTATLVDDEGAVMANSGGTPLTFSLSTSGTTAALASKAVTIPPGESSATATLITGGSAGTVTLVGSGPLPVDGLQLTVRPAGLAAKMILQTERAEATADGVTAVAVDVAIADADGTVRTAEQGTAAYLAVRGPDGGVQTLAQLISSGVARFNLRQGKPGRYTLEATSGGGSLAPGSGAITFLAPTAGGGAATGPDPGPSAGGGTPAPTPGGSPGGSAVDAGGGQSGGAGTPATVPTVGSPQPGFAVELFASQTSLPTGQPISVEVKVKDVSGQLALADGERTLSLLASSDGVTIQPRSQVGTGGRAVFKVTGLAPGAYILTATAHNVGNPMASASFTFTGQNLAARAQRLEFATPTAPLGVGTAAQVQLVLRTGSGQLATTDVRPITLSTSNPAISIRQPTVVPVAGYATFTVTAARAGMAIFHASGAEDITGATGTLAFGGGMSGWAMSLGLSGLRASYAIGTPYPVQVQSRDAFGQVVPLDEGRPVQLQIIGQNGTVTPGLANTAGGTATFQVTAQSTGPAVLSATSSGLNPVAAAVVFGTQAPKQVRIQLNPTVTYKADAPLTFQVAVVDENGNVVTGDNGRALSLAASSGVTVTNSAAMTAGGYATFTVTVPQSGTKTLLAVAGGLEPHSLALTFSTSGVNPTIPLPSSLSFVLAQSGPLSVGTPVGFQVMIKDQFGQVMAGENYRPVEVTASGPVAFNPASTTTWAGVASFVLTPTGPGSATLTANVAGLAPAQLPLTVNAALVPTVNGNGPAGPPYRVEVRAQQQVVVGGQLLVTVVLVDQAGRSLDEPRVPVALSVDPTKATLSAQSVQTPAGVTLTALQSPGPITVSGTAGGYPVQPVTISITSQ